MKGWKIVLIPFVLVILAVGGALAYNWWPANEIAPGTTSLEGDLQGVADWAKGEQGLELLGEYTFATTDEVDKTKIKKVYAYQLSDGSVYGWLSYCEEQQEEWTSDAEYVVSGSCADYAKVLAEAEAQHWEKELFLGYYSSRGMFFSIGDAPEILAGYFVSCTEGLSYDIYTQ